MSCRLAPRAARCLLLFAAGCAAGPSPDAPVQDGRWAIAIHGGAGTIDRGSPKAELDGYRDALGMALAEGRLRLARGDAALDVCEAVVRMLEDDPHFNAGKGAAFDEQGHHTLDASIMDGTTLACGAVAGVRTVRHPITLARRVMTDTPHVLLMGDGAEDFATAAGVERVPNEWFDTEPRRRMLEDVLRERARGGTAAAPRAPTAAVYGTVGCVVRDKNGRLAAATSTGGLTGKRFGRVGDSPIVGAGNYADAFAAISGTGTGEEFIRHAVARTIAARMQFGGESLQAAADAVVLRTLHAGDGGVIAVDRAGNLAAVYNSDGMYRALADSKGRFEVAIFADG
jgi:beta-aspartyl-peptidase (threonine type)